MLQVICSQIKISRVYWHFLIFILFRKLSFTRPSLYSKISCINDGAYYLLHALAMNTLFQKYLKLVEKSMSSPFLLPYSDQLLSNFSVWDTEMKQITHFALSWNRWLLILSFLLYSQTINLITTFSTNSG